MIKVIKLLTTCTRQLIAKANSNEWCTMLFSQFPPKVFIVYPSWTIVCRDIQNNNCEPKLTTWFRAKGLIMIELCFCAMLMHMQLSSLWIEKSFIFKQRRLKIFFFLFQQCYQPHIGHSEMEAKCMFVLSVE